MTFYAAMVTCAALAAFPMQHARVAHCPGVARDASVGELILADGLLEDWRLFHHPAPAVSLQISGDCHPAPLAWPRLSSRDLSNAWTPLPVGALTAELAIEGVDLGSVAAVELLLDGRPIPPGQADVLTYTIPCPTPGRHEIQARYLLNHIWSYYSPPLRFEIQLPQRPTILAISNVNEVPVAPERNGIVRITSGGLTLKLGNVQQHDKVIAYIDGQAVETLPDLGLPCCRTIHLCDLLTPGTHTLVVRSTACDNGCAMASPPSNKLLFHYYNEDAYVLRPGGGCPCCAQKGCAPAASHGDQSSRLQASPFQFAQHKSSERVARSTATPQSKSPFMLVAYYDAAGDAAKAKADAEKKKAEAAETLIDTAFATATTNVELAIAQQAGVSDYATKISQLVTNEEVSLETARQDVTAIGEQIAQSEKFKGERFKAIQSELKAAGKLSDEALKAAEITMKGFKSHIDKASETKKICGERVEIANRSLVKLREAKSRADKHLLELYKNLDNFPAVDPEATKRFERIQAIVVEIEKERDLAKTRADTIVFELKNSRAQRKVASEQLAEALKSQEKLTSELAPVASAKTEAAKKLQELVQHALMVPNPAGVTAASFRNKAAESYAAAKRHRDAAYQAATKAREYSNAANVAAKQAHSDSLNNGTAIQQADEYLERILAAVRESNALVDKSLAESLKVPTVPADVARQQESRRVAVDNLTEAIKRASLAQEAHKEVLKYQDQTVSNATEVELHANAARLAATQANSDAAQAVALCDEVKLFVDAAEAAELKVQLAVQGGLDTAVGIREVANAAKQAANSATKVLKTLEVARNQEAAAAAALNRAELAASRAHQTAAALEKLKKAAQPLPPSTSQLETQLQNLWAAAEESARQQALLQRIAAAKASTGDVDVQHANDSAQTAITQANRDEQKADARIRGGEAKARSRLADRIDGPASPFVFASAAHFPLPSFGQRGEPIANEGLLIYEDMKFEFDREGNYTVRFRATAPEMPATLRLQFLLQPRHGGPWYTVTLSPIDFQYPLPPSNGNQVGCANCEHGSPAEEGKQCCGKTRDCVCTGHSEILRRCYAELGQNARIRRVGTVRFGFGVEVP